MHRALVVATFLLSLAHVQGQILESRSVDGKEIVCMHSGLFSDLNNCSTRSNWYTYVFVGTIAQIVPTPDGEKQLQIIPTEIFSGKPANPLTVLTSQGACLPELKPGDPWLFYLRASKDKPLVLDFYGNDSLPVPQAQRQIETLRELRSIGDLGLLRGHVWRGRTTNGKPLPGAIVNAQRESDDTRYATISDAEGNYEFPPLPKGKYVIRVTTNEPYPPDDSSVTISAGSCWDLALSRSPHAVISGFVHDASGRPTSNIDLVLIDSTNDSYVTTQTDKNGHFSYSSLEPGEYVVGVNWPPNPDWQNGSGAGRGIDFPPASWFYPGESSRSRAGTIQLTTDQIRDDIDFVLPAP